MRIQSGKLVSLGYGRYVRSDEVVAIEPITEGRGPGRRCLVWVRGVADPIVASRSQSAIIHDLSTPETERRTTEAAARAAPPRKPAARAIRTKARRHPPKNRRR
ncbi:MAG: hypothetical protein WEC75_04700 [Dehalococcoidia bacterium]